jgi:hypothetical protein
MLQPSPGPDPAPDGTRPLLRPPGSASTAWPLRFMIGILAVSILAAYWYLTSQTSTGFTTEQPTEMLAWQTEAWMQGQLHLPIEPHPALARLPNPYDGAANEPYRILDISYYDGRYYSYFGVGPVVSLLLPWRGLTGTHLTAGTATAIFASFGFLVQLALLLWLRRRFFSAGPNSLFVGAILMVGAGNLQPELLVGAQFYQVAQTCGQAFLVAALGALLLASARPARATAWLAIAGTCAAIAVAARPNFIPVAIVLAAVAVLGPSSPGRLRLRARGVRLAAAVGPLAAGVAGMLLHNWLRFDSFLEFGARYQLTSIDTTDRTFFDIERFWTHLQDYLLGPIRWTTAFPFISIHSDEPVGLLYLPFLFGVFLLITFARANKGAALHAWIVSTAVSLLCIFGLLVCYVYAWRRYQPDLTVPLTFAAALGWCLAVTHPSSRLRRLGRVGTPAAFVTLALTLGGLISQVEHLPVVRKLALTAEAPARAWRHFTQEPSGPLLLQVRFPAAQEPRMEPLVSTGSEGANTFYVRYHGNGEISVGYWLRGLGGPESAPFQVDPDRVYTLECFMGTFLGREPALNLRGWSADDIERARRLIWVRVDQEVALASAAYFHDAAQTRPVVASTTSGGQFAPEFTGQIVSRHQRALTTEDLVFEEKPSAPALELTLRFAGSRTGATEPILSTGRRGAGDVLSVHYLEEDQVRFEIDRWGMRRAGPTFHLPPHQDHVVRIWWPPLGDPEHLDQPAIVMVGDQIALSTQGAAPAYPTRADEAFFNINSIGAGTTGVMFSGTLVEVRDMTEAELQPVPVAPALEPDTLVVLAQFPTEAPRLPQVFLHLSELPEEDRILVEVLEPHLVRFGFSRTAASPVRWGQPLEVHPENLYRLRLHPSESGVGWQLSLDDQLALPLPAQAPLVLAGVNVAQPTAADGTATAFTGEVIQVLR